MWYSPQRMIFTWNDFYNVYGFIFLLLRESNQHEILMHIHSNKLHKMFFVEYLGCIDEDYTEQQKTNFHGYLDILYQYLGQFKRADFGYVSYLSLTLHSWNICNLKFYISITSTKSLFYFFFLNCVSSFTHSRVIVC